MMPKLPPWVRDPERLPDRFWKPSLNVLRRPPAPEGWHPELRQALHDQGQLPLSLLDSLASERLLTFDPDPPIRWQGPVNLHGDPVLVMPPPTSRWGVHLRVRAETALWALMYPELVEAQWMVVRYHKRRRQLAPELSQLNVNPWHHWPGGVKGLHLRQALGPDLWFEFRRVQAALDAPLLSQMEEEDPALVESLEDSLDFEFLDT